MLLTGRRREPDDGKSNTSVKEEVMDLLWSIRGGRWPPPTAKAHTKEVEPEMHIPDTRLSRALMETRIAEAKRVAERDRARPRKPGAMDQLKDWWQQFLENISPRPPRLPGGGHWGRHGPQHP